MNNRAAVEQMRIIVHDPELFVFNPRPASEIGWDAFVKNFDVPLFFA